jgi:hypothetical protein
VELSRRANPAAVRQRFPDTATRSFIVSSDAHWLEAMRPARTSLIAREPTLAELGLALHGHEGRRVVIDEQADATH